MEVFCICISLWTYNLIKDIQKATFPLHAITVDDKQPMRLYYNSVVKEFWLEVPLHFVHKGEISKININLSSLNGGYN